VKLTRVWKLNRRSQKERRVTKQSQKQKNIKSKNIKKRDGKREKGVLLTFCSSVAELINQH
jgi:hypothetical protein